MLPWIATTPAVAEPPSLDVGAAVLRITHAVDNVQRSNYGKNSFTVINTGGKAITGFTLDVTGALYPDCVFDPEGLAGDSVAKPLNIDTPGGTGLVAPIDMQDSPYVGEGGAKGYRGLQLVFDPEVDGGFSPDESVGFSIDMDPNSIAGTNKKPLDQGTTPKWDVGGVSGAELIGSTFTVTFADGSQAQGQLHGTTKQAGSHGLASQDLPGHDVTLTVNGLAPGEVGTYSDEGIQVVVNGPAGLTARVVLTHGLIQPVTPYADFLTEQLEVLAAADFPANNAAWFQTLDVMLTGEDQDITEALTNAPRPTYDFTVHPDKPFSLDADKLPVGVVAAVVDPANDALPMGPVTEPIYLKYE
ncbi:hypothetical protein [Algisphaera agarilytica]|uniref:Uncharacterized protein n=1 Tax=Algisphaera agarilytica TaxID=1385975 RepID=A0A7X0LIK4_9BACT|nr:hypothetical protein [Algisphaera agarilytica]MBB6428310.1 hypothetical protein [Algisphaera agarilytica]